METLSLCKFWGIEHNIGKSNLCRNPLIIRLVLYTTESLQVAKATYWIFETISKYIS